MTYLEILWKGYEVKLENTDEDNKNLGSDNANINATEGQTQSLQRASSTTSNGSQSMMDHLCAIARDVGVLSEVKEITFYEHKVNGKSRGVAYVEFTTEEAASKVKERLEEVEITDKKCLVNFTSSANGNPFKTVPKEPPSKASRQQQPSVQQRSATSGNLPIRPIMRPTGGGMDFHNRNSSAAAFRNRQMVPGPRDFFSQNMSPYGTGAFGTGATAAGRVGYMNSFGGPNDVSFMMARGRMMNAAAMQNQAAAAAAARQRMMSRAPTGPGAGYPAPHFNPAFFDQGLGNEDVPVAPRGQSLALPKPLNTNEILHELKDIAGSTL
nr:546_t:CDS:2 [Entrophospora candida]